MSEETVELTIRIPEQFFTQVYSKAEFLKAKADSDLPYLTDAWASDLDIQEELYGPDGQQLQLYAW